jgi:hypothetical protein
MIGALQRLGERWALARNAVRCLKSVAEIVFARCDEDGSLLSQAHSFRDSAIDEGDSASNPMWFDLFSVDELQGNFFDI